MGKLNDLNEQNRHSACWIFKRKAGSGLFFDKEGKIVTATTEK